MTDAKKDMMAQCVETTLIDDLDGSEASETVAFAVDGSSYEIDLSKSNAAAMRRARSQQPCTSSATPRRPSVRRAA